MRLSPPFVVFSGSNWDPDLGSEVRIAATNHFPEDPSRLETPNWNRMPTEYELSSSGAQGPIGFRAPSHGQVSIVTHWAGGPINIPAEKYVIFQPMMLGTWAFASKNMLWAQPHGNALVFRWQQLYGTPTEDLMSRLIYHRIYANDPIRFVRSTPSGDDELEQLIDQNSLDQFNRLSGGPAVNEAVRLAEGAAPRAATFPSTLPIPILKDTIIELPGLTSPATIWLGGAHAPTKGGRVAADDYWTWIDADAVLHHLNDRDEFDPRIELVTDSRDTYVRMWHENDDVTSLARKSRVTRVDIGNTQFFNPPESGTISEDVISIRETTKFNSMDTSSVWNVELLDFDTNNVLVSEIFPASSKLSISPWFIDPPSGTETGLRVNKTTGTGATYRNRANTRRVWIVFNEALLRALGSSLRQYQTQWRQLIREINPTDITLMVSEKTLAIQHNVQFNISPQRSNDIAEIAKNLHELGITPHLGLYIYPLEPWLQTSGNHIWDIVRKAGRTTDDKPVIESIIFHLEQPWGLPETTSYFSSWPPLGLSNIDEYIRLVQNILLTSYRPSVNFGVKLCASEEGTRPDDWGIRRERCELVYQVCDWLLPLAYTSARPEHYNRVPGAYQKRIVRDWKQAYDKPLIVGLTLEKQHNVRGLNVREAMRRPVAASLKHPALGVSYWSLNFLQQRMRTSPGTKDVLTRICEEARKTRVVSP